MRKPIPRAELLKIASSLENYHKIFFTFWEMSSVYFTDEVPTAAVIFGTKNSGPTMLINEEFWNNLTQREKVFVICHECLHVFLNHGIRNGKDIEGSTPDLVNKAQDITINHMIVDLFKFERSELRGWGRFCWIETCFKDHALIRRNETFDYYLKKLIEDPDAAKNAQTFDTHSDPDDLTEEQKEEQMQTAIDLGRDLDPEDLKSVINALPKEDDPTKDTLAGKLSGALKIILEKKTRPIKLNITSLIKKLKRTRLKFEEKNVESFVKENRRLSSLGRSGIQLPGTHVSRGGVKDRLLTALFMDVSGSCISYLPTFNRILNVFEENNDVFDVYPFAFDTRVIPIDKSRNLTAGGGTSFRIIEDKIRELQSEFKRYPDCVIVVTDGYGDAVKPVAPTKWIWLLTPGNTKNCIPVGSKIFEVKQVEF